MCLVAILPVSSIASPTLSGVVEHLRPKDLMEEQKGNSCLSHTFTINLQLLVIKLT